MADESTRSHPASEPPTVDHDPNPDAAFGHGWSAPPMLRDEPSDGGPVVRPDSIHMPKGGAGQYQLLGEIARGGMGVVLKGRDPDLGRDLAVKVLKAELAGHESAERRFVEEAQVGGQLQHPGIVPVYELGRFADGRPYFTMKLVKGRTLAALLSERSTPAVDRGRFLKVFEQICQTLAYAHSKGVIHRDLKPANVMVGNFGEVQVMDWAGRAPEPGKSETVDFIYLAWFRNQDRLALKWTDEQLAVNPGLKWVILGGQSNTPVVPISAIRLGTGRGPDAVALDETARSKYREQARADLIYLRTETVRRFEGATRTDKWASVQKLIAWTNIPHLTPIREAKELAKLPAAERAAWQTFWAETSEQIKAFEAVLKSNSPAAQRITAGPFKRNQSDWRGAVDDFRTAIGLDPTNALAHFELAKTYEQLKQLDAALSEFRAAARAKPDFAEAHYNLGRLVRDGNDLPGAEAAFRNAIKHKPDYAEALCDLGQLLRTVGKYAEALTLLQSGHQIGAKRPGWSMPSGQWVGECEKEVQWARRLPEVKLGRDRITTTTERFGLAGFAMSELHKEYGLALRLLDAILSDPSAGAVHVYVKVMAPSVALHLAAGHDPSVPIAAEEWHVLNARALQWMDYLVALNKLADANNGSKKGEAAIRANAVAKHVRC